MHVCRTQFKSFIAKALDELKFTEPSPIQQKTIPWLLAGRDLIGQAQTGTGKTAAFALPILQNLKLNNMAVQALIVTPTRELAIQVAQHFEILSKYQKIGEINVLCGGQDYRPQLRKLKEGAQIVVGTPGRILDHIDRGSLKLQHLTTFVLDEADEMLRMGFIDDVESILAKLPAEKQMALFSATLPTRIRNIANRYLNDPVSVEIKSETATVKAIEQRFLFASPHQKLDALVRILTVEDYQGVIVFVRTKNNAQEIAEALQQKAYRALALHGDLSQPLENELLLNLNKEPLIFW